MPVIFVCPFKIRVAEFDCLSVVRSVFRSSFKFKVRGAHRLQRLTNKQTNKQGLAASARWHLRSLGSGGVWQGGLRPEPDNCRTQRRASARLRQVPVCLFVWRWKSMGSPHFKLEGRAKHAPHDRKTIEFSNSNFKRANKNDGDEDLIAVIV